MNVVVHTDHSIGGDAAMRSRAASEVETSLEDYEDRVVRVEVHLSQESGGRFSRDSIRCVMEAFMEGESPAVASEHADTMDDAVCGTAHRLDRVIEARLARPGAAARGPDGVCEPAPDLTESGW